MSELEKMALQLKELKEKSQNEFIDKLKNDVEWLCEKANKKEYQATEHEKQVFNSIRTIINDMNNWF